MLDGVTIPALMNQPIAGPHLSAMQAAALQRSHACPLNRPTGHLGAHGLEKTPMATTPTSSLIARPNDASS